MDFRICLLLKDWDIELPGFVFLRTITMESVSHWPFKAEPQFAADSLTPYCLFACEATGD
jgi:hypothetical protein